MKERMLTGWTFQRVLLLLIGVSLIGQSAVEKQWIGAIAGSYFAAMGLFGFGCAAGNCYAKPEQNATIDFHEIKPEEEKQK